MFQSEVNFFSWLLEDLNWTSVERSFCSPSEEVLAIWIIFSVEFVVVCLALLGLCCFLRSDRAASIFVINLFISDLLQICVKPFLHSCKLNLVVLFLFYVYISSIVANIGFMVSISLERYVMIKFPVWYRLHHTHCQSVMCLVVWAIPFGLVGVDVFLAHRGYLEYAFLLSLVVLVLPYPLVVFCLVGTWRALSSSLSVGPNERRRILGVLALVLFSYSVLFLPSIVRNFLFFLSYEFSQNKELDFLHSASGFLLYLNPLADVMMYVLIRKDASNMFKCCGKTGNQV